MVVLGGMVFIYNPTTRPCSFCIARLVGLIDLAAYSTGSTLSYKFRSDFDIRDNLKPLSVLDAVFSDDVVRGAFHFEVGGQSTADGGIVIAAVRGRRIEAPARASTRSSVRDNAGDEESGDEPFSPGTKRRRTFLTLRGSLTQMLMQTQTIAAAVPMKCRDQTMQGLRCL